MIKGETRKVRSIIQCLTGLSMLALLSTGCGDLFFYPEKNYRLVPTSIGLKYEDHWIPLVARNEELPIKLHAWLLLTPENATTEAAKTNETAFTRPIGAADSEPPKGLILFFHGNAENISTHIESVSWLPEKGYEVLLVDYRGYGTSGGEPSIETLAQDAQAVFDYAKALRPNTYITLLGQSLGAAAALSVLANQDNQQYIQAAIVDSAFSSFRKIAEDKVSELWPLIPFASPLSLTIPDEPNPNTLVRSKSDIPLLILGGTDDNVVPIYHSYKLYQSAPQPSQMWAFPGLKHIEALKIRRIQNRVVDFIEHG